MSKATFYEPLANQEECVSASPDVLDLAPVIDRLILGLIPADDA